MKNLDISQKLEELRSKYLQTADLTKHEEDLAQEDVKRLLGLKKKLMQLEMERCHQRRQQQDLTLIDRKILKQKDLFLEAEKKMKKER